MSLLTQILTGLAGNGPGQSSQDERTGGGGGLGMGGGGGGGGTSQILMALLPVVLSMLANRQRSSAADEGMGAIPGMGGGGGGLGGLGDLLGGLAGGQRGGVGGGLGGALGGLGGLGGLLEQFTQKGYGQQASSWVGTGANEPLPPEALSDVFGQDGIASIASQAGVSEEDARTGLSQLLPQVVDHLTPSGQVSAQDQLLASIDAFQQQLPR